VGLEKIDRAIMDNCKNLKIIAKYGVGLDNIDVEYCRQRNIHIGWTPGVNRLSVAEMTLSFMIGLSRNIFLTSSQLAGGRWNKNGGHDLSHKSVGIIGAGNVGKELLRLLKPFRCRIMVNDVIDQTEYYRENQLVDATKEEIYKNSDLVTLHTPLTRDTHGMIDKNVLALMKKSAFLINTARGPIVRASDLKWALKHNIIAGAALDVYDEEPPKDLELLKLPNLICTPHIGGNSSESVLAMGRSAIRHLRDFSGG
jgi:D-3-phosphoglycerate dehydrogenase